MLKALTAHHREIARLKFEGCRAAEIAERLQQPIVSVRNILADPLCKAHIAMLNDKADSASIQVRKRIAQLTVQAVDRLEDALDPNNDSIGWSNVITVARDVLDRAGHMPKQQINHMHGHFTADDLKELAQEAKANGANITDIDYLEIDA